MKYPHRFTIAFYACRTHHCDVTIYKTQGAMRHRLNRSDPSTCHNDTQAACWQSNNPAKDNCVAELIFCLPGLTIEHIAHECCHAAYHRAVILGIHQTNPEFQEFVAEGSGLLTELVISYLDKYHIPVRVSIKQ